MHYYNDFKKCYSVKRNTFNSLLNYLSHLFAYPYGSIIKGHLSALETITPLSTDTLSFGKPLIIQSLITIAFSNVFDN